MLLIPESITCVLLSTLPEEHRRASLRALEFIISAYLAESTCLSDWQTRLYKVIEELNGRGFFLGRWDYDSEVEIWGGPSFMDPRKENDLLLRSEFPKGVTLAWQRYEDLGCE